MKYASPFIAALLTLALLAGCSEEAADVRKPAPPAKKAIAKPPQQSTDPAAAAETVETTPPEYRYDPTGRDPFVSLLEVKKPLTPEGMLTPLQKFDLGQLRLIGLIIGKGEPRAMVVAPDGKSYILKRGVKVGKNGGEVIAVNREAVLVEERYIDFSGDVRTVNQEIMLPKQEGA